MPIRVLRQCLLFALYLRSSHPLASRTTPLSLERLVQCLPDGVAGPQANPLWDRAVLLLRFGELLLRPEGLVGLQIRHQYITVSFPKVLRTYRHL